MVRYRTRSVAAWLQRIERTFGPHAQIVSAVAELQTAAAGGATKTQLQELWNELRLHELLMKSYGARATLHGVAKTLAGELGIRWSPKRGFH